MSGFVVRPATGADLDAIGEGFARACGRAPERVVPKVRWALGGNPAGWTGVVGVTGRGIVVAHFGVSHVPMIVAGEPRTFGRVYAAFVEPSWRIAGDFGPFVALDAAFRAAFEETGHAAIYGAFEDSDWWVLRRAFSFEPVRDDVTLVREPAPARPGEPRVELQRVTAKTAGSWAKPLAAGMCHARHDGATIAFRTGGPYAGTDVAWLATRGGDPAGLVLWRDGPGGRVVLDLVACERDEECAGALFDAAIGDGARTVTLPWFSRSPHFLFAQRRGFRVATRDLPYLAFRARDRRLRAHALMDAWLLGAADAGLRPLPRMLR